MKFRILGHASMEVASNGASLVCDPWLVGSAYWRSWWNFPPTPRGLLDTLAPDFIYLSHLHWDHFHGPTLRRLGLQRPILVPRTPDRRLIGDLRAMGCRDIRELDHGKRTQLREGFWITSYQIGPFADSALVMEADGVTLLNANDAKFMGWPLQQILKRHPRIDFVFRSHSSANSRLCYEFPDAPGEVLDDLTKYSHEFFDFCRAVQPRYAIPFASNHCFLHDETFRFNGSINFGFKVEDFFRARGIESPECIAMAPGDSWDSASGFSMAEPTRDIDAVILDYRRRKTEILDAQRAKEDRSSVAVPAVAAHLQRILNDTPWLMRRLFRGTSILIVGHSARGDKALEVNVAARTVREIEPADVGAYRVRIHTSALIVNDCARTRNWNSLGISKRVRFVCPRKDASLLRLFNYLLNAHEYEIFPLRKTLNARFASVWMRRWRELALYAHVGGNLLLRRGFEVSRHLPVRPRARHPREASSS